MDSVSSSSEDETEVRRRAELLSSVDKSLLNDGVLLGADAVPAEEGLVRVRCGRGTRDHVAQRLARLLDNRLRHLPSGCEHQHRPIESFPTSGIKLFSSSSILLTDDYNRVQRARPAVRKVVGRERLEKVDRATLCNAVAVSSDWILSGDCVRGWAKDTKGHVFRLKKVRTLEKGALECCPIDT